MTIKAENWVGEYTSTVGNGDIILGGAIDGFTAFAALGDGVEVYYTIMDGLNKETGIGYLDGGTLIRKTIQATLIDGAYVKGAGALLLSGDAQVYGTANADFLHYVNNISDAVKQVEDQVKQIMTWTINTIPMGPNVMLDAAAVGARPNTWVPSPSDIDVYGKGESDTRYVRTNAVEAGQGLIMRAGGEAATAMAQLIDGHKAGYKQHSVAGIDWQGQISNRNLLINGDMRISQRGNVFNRVSNDQAYTADRWIVGGTGSAWTAAVNGPLSDNTVPSKKCLNINGDAGNTEIYIRQMVESVNCQFPVGIPMTVSAYLSSDVSKPMKMQVFAFGGVDTINPPTLVKEQIVNLIGGKWSRYDMTFTTTDSMRNGFFINFSSVSASITDHLYLTCIQCELGSYATPFEIVNFATELAKCQRYFWNPISGPEKLTFNKSLTWSSAPILFPVRMRIAPRVILTTTEYIIGDMADLTKNSRNDLFFYSTSNGNAGVVEVGLMFDAEII